MSIADLISALSKLNPDMRVVVNGYETGFDVVHTVMTISVVPRQWRLEPGEYDGELSLCSKGKGETVAFIPRTSS